jgi:hypothetical protein
VGCCAGAVKDLSQLCASPTVWFGSLPKPRISPRPFELSLSKPGCARGLADGGHALVEGGGRESPGMRVPFFWVAKRKEPKKRRPYRLRPCASLRATCGARGRSALRNSLCAARAAQTAAASQSTKPVCPSAHRPPRPLRSSAHPEGNPGPNIHTGHCFAALRSAPPSRAQAPRAAKARPSNATARVAVWLSHPLLAAPAAGRLRGGMGVEAPMLRDLTRRGCPSGAAQQQSEFHGAPRNRPAAGLPRSEAQGSQTGGRLFFAYFLLAKQKKVSRRRATPGSRHPTRHAAKQRARERTPVPTSSARTADKVPRPRKDPTQQQHNRYYFNSFPRLSIKAQSLKGHKTEGHPSVGIHLADEPDLQRFNLTEIGAALAAKGYFSPLRGLCTANAVTSFQLLLKSGFLFLRKILQPATRSSPLPR